MKFKIIILLYICIYGGGSRWPFTIQIYDKIALMTNASNLWLMHTISSKLWGNAQDYGLDGYYRI